MWAGYHYRNDTSTSWTDCTSTTGTTPTDWYYPLTICTPVSGWPKLVLSVPKCWRWYDVFRIWARIPKLCADYADDHGVLHSITFEMAEARALMATQP